MTPGPGVTASTTLAARKAMRVEVFIGSGVLRGPSP
jgi:hypothetical protein